METDKGKTSVVVEVRVEITTLAALSKLFPEITSKGALVRKATEIAAPGQPRPTIHRSLKILKKRGLLQGGKKFRRSLTSVLQADVREVEGSSALDIIEEMEREKEK